MATKGAPPPEGSPAAALALPTRDRMVRTTDSRPET